MAAEPLIIDDGGSTRIKQAKDDVEMDKLLKAPHTDGADGTFINGTGSAKCRVKITTVRADGVPISSGPFDFGGGETAVIVSQLGQKVTVKLDTTGSLQVTLGPAGGGGAQPIVEAKQSALRRRYIVANAGPIDTVTVRGTLVFTAAADSIYNMVRLSDS
jgi:hypothetical protein